ncbi:MAG: HisA/HisF-related TIM barrel protein, partial [Clostridia bacterium]|nr:HisA/HisF-related TIM barrel protein [Clostridia bacterium]
MKMILYPAIDLYEGKAVRLLKGNYNDMTVYSLDPPSIAEDFRNAGATHMHVVDLEGAKSGLTPNLETILAIKARGGLFVEVGGGIRTMEVIDKYLSSGIDRVILGTAAVTSPG